MVIIRFIFRKGKAMPRRGENIHKRKDGRWEGRYKKNDNFSKKTKYGSVYGKTYREVKTKLLEIYKNNSIMPVDNCNKKYFKDVLLFWFECNHMKYKGSTENKYEYLIQKHIIPELGDIEMEDLSVPIINCFIDNKLNSGRLDNNGGLSASYVRNIVLIINAAINFAINEDMCRPLKNNILKPIPEKKEMRVLTISEQKRLESILLKDIDETKVGILISLYTGLRIGEICALSWKNVDLEERIIHVRYTVARVKNTNYEKKQNTILIIDKPKTKSSIRDIPIPSKLFDIIKSLKEYSVSEYLVSNTKNFISPRTFEYRFHRIIDSVGLYGVNYHALRHTFATRCIEANVDIKSLSEMLGHSNVSITLNTYVHSSMELKRQQIEKLYKVL